jgi:perosamine synthetase
MKKRPIPLADVTLSSAAFSLITKTLKKNRLTYGTLTKRFERQFARINNVSHAIFCNSGTSALQLALTALKISRGWSDGDEVLVPAVTFIASSNAVLHTNLTPVFVDVEPNYYCINPHEIEKHITPKTRAIMPVHLFGQSADMNAIRAIAKRHHLAIIEDAAEALFTTYRGKPVGSLSDVAIFSTYAAHTITTGVGGFAVTNDATLAKIIQSLCYHGRDIVYRSIDDDDTTNRVKLLSLIERRFHFPYIGFSFRLTELEAALGLAELTRTKRIIRERKRVDSLLRHALKPLENHIAIPEVREDTAPVFMLYPLILKNPAIDLDLFLLHLEQRGIETRLFFPLLDQPIYKKMFGDITSRYPVAKALTARGFIIGCHPGLTKRDIAMIADTMASYIQRYA